MILLIDNYDSFVHNLARYLERFGCETQVVRNDVISTAEIRALRPAAIVLSPGPCTPAEAGCCLESVRCLSGHIPILGVCLGHQAIAAAFGAKIVRTSPMHGQASQIDHNRQGIFRELPNPLNVGRYHSLVVEPSSLPPDLQVTARCPDGAVMAIRHRHHVTVGVQFHPESILTECGYGLLKNFLDLAGFQRNLVPTFATEFTKPIDPFPPLPNVPVTF